MMKLALIFVACLVNIALSQTCYITTQGVDNIYCNQTIPCQTINQCADIFGTSQSFTINFAAGLYGLENCNVTLSSSATLTSHIIIIEATDPNTVTISCNNTSRHFTFQNLASSAIFINNINFMNGYSDDLGGCIQAKNTSLVVTGSSFSGCSAMYGGAIFSDTLTTIANSSFQLCTVTNGGGGLYLVAGSNGTSVTNSSINGNTAASGGGIYVVGDYLTLIDTNVTFNTAGNGAGLYLNSSSVNFSGIYNFNGANVSNNTATLLGGGLYANNVNYSWNVFGAYFGYNLAVGSSADDNIACSLPGSPFCFACYAPDCDTGCVVSGSTSCTQNATTAFCYSTTYNDCSDLKCKCQLPMSKVEKILIVFIIIMAAIGIALVVADVTRYFIRKRRENTYSPIR